ncbi:unnamed protein product [Caenorhabditis brenneri]
MEASQIPRKPFLDWVLENTKDCPRPEKTSSLCVRYMGGSKPKNAMNFRSQIKRAVVRKDKNSQLTPHQIVQLCFLLSIAVPEHRKDDLKEAGTLSLDQFDRIESFSAFDGSYEKKGTHSFYGLAKNPKRNKDVMITVQRLGEGSSRKVPVIAAPTITARRLSKQILNYSAVIETACLPLFKMQHQQVSSRPNQDITQEVFSNKFQEAHGALSLAATLYPTRTDRFVPFIECLKLLKFLLLNLDVPEEHNVTKKVSEDIRIFTNGVAATFVPITSIDYMLTKLYEVIN